MTYFTDTEILKDPDLESSEREDILLNRIIDFARALLDDGAEPADISYYLAYVATGMGLRLTDNAYSVFPCTLKGVVDAGRNARRLEKLEGGENIAAGSDSSTLKRGSALTGRELERTMIKGRPKFCVGELVAIVSVLRPDFNCQSTEIIGIEYHEQITVRDITYTGWIYYVASNPKRWCEQALRKLPPGPDNSFEFLMGKLTEQDTADNNT